MKKTHYYNITKAIILLIVLQVSPLVCQAQRPNYSKLSPMLRGLVRQEVAQSRSMHPIHHAKKAADVCAFVKIAKDGEQALNENECQILTQMDDICIVNIPIRNLRQLSLDSRILRIEANKNTHPQTDSMAWYLNALPVYEGLNLQQAYTGKGVIVGVMDIGFDLTHPNFYSRDATTYRIKKFWDMLSDDTLGSKLYVGRDYVGREALLDVAHSRDGLDQTHGTHTLGIAAGSGYDSPYQGMAYESDICIVANAVSADKELIDTADYYKYTYATDALGFKYIFDYAESQGKPCVINFSEGSGQDFWGYDLLYYEMLSKLIGPGRIIVSAAGNNGYDKTWFHKAAGEVSAGSFLRSSSTTGMLTLKSANDFNIRLVAYGKNSNDTLIINTKHVVTQEDSILYSTINVKNDTIKVMIEAYPSCYIADETCYDLTLTGQKKIGTTTPLSFEVIGKDSNIEVYRVTGNLVENTELNPSLTAGERSHSILSPSSSPDIICVGATFYRQGIINYLGQWREQSKGNFGEWAIYSSIGPTYDERIKPDVVAPGSNIISSYSSYYLENHPNANDIGWDVKHFDFNGRTYAWNSNTGTSMSSPAVAGAIALWLQAKPDLTPEMILDVFKHTCRHYDETLTYPNNYYGYGEIDVYRGLLYLLGIDKIEGISTTQSKAHISYSDGRIIISFGESHDKEVNLHIYTLSGKQVLSVNLPANKRTHTVQLPHLPKAIYAVQINEQSEAGNSTLIAIP